MLRSSQRALISLGFVAILATSGPFMLHLVGCGSGDAVHGLCPRDPNEGNACTDNYCDDAGVITSKNRPEGDECTFGKSTGRCEKGNCILVCKDRSGCPTSTYCQDWDCQNGKCQATVHNVDASVPDTDAGFCKDIICTGEGTTKLILSPSRKPANMDGCHISGCADDGGTTQDLKDAGEPCTGASDFCDGEGKCSFCAKGTSTGCDAGDLCYQEDAGTLTCTHCTDSEQNKDEETDLNCGGICAKYDAGATPKCDNGKKCVADAGTDCANGLCVDGFCCETACGDSCKACDNPGFEGLCRDAPTGTSDPTCETGSACVAGRMGKCFAHAGTTCTQGAQCMSGTCTAGKCAKGIAGTPCGDSMDCAAMLNCGQNHFCN